MSLEVTLLKYLLAAATLLISIEGFSLECPVAGHQHLPENKDIIFFASWCSSCLEKISQSDPKKSLYVAVFDEKKAAEEALSYGLGEKSALGRCLMDHSDKIAKRYQLHSLPHKVIKAKKDQQ